MGEKRSRRITTARTAMGLVLTTCMLVAAVAGFAGNNPGQNALAADTDIHNPIISTVGDKSVTWSRVAFGSYPQTEVTGADLTDAIKGAEYNNNGIAEVGGKKYKRLKQTDATYSSISKNDCYFDWTTGGDANGYHYFVFEPIVWRVLKVDGAKVLLFADTGLDDRKYNESSSDTTWKSSTIRSWLNGYADTENDAGTNFTSNNFYDVAFSAEEKTKIVSTALTTDDNEQTKVQGGLPTEDKVFLLSMTDMANTSYGFNALNDEGDQAKRTKNSTFASAMGAFSDVSPLYAGNAKWWVRTPGMNGGYAAYVDNIGYRIFNGELIANDFLAVRPAITIEIESAQDVDIVDDVIADETKEDFEKNNQNIPETNPPTSATPGPIDNPDASALPTQTPLAKPARVKKVKVSNLKGKKMKVTWAASANAKKYSVQYALNKKFTKKCKTKVTKKCKITIKKLKKKKTYFVRVKSINGKLKSTKFSVVKKVKIKK